MDATNPTRTWDEEMAERMKHLNGIIESQIRAAIGNHPELWNREDHRYDSVRSVLWNALTVISNQRKELAEVREGYGMYQRMYYDATRTHKEKP